MIATQDYNGNNRQLLIEHAELKPYISSPDALLRLREIETRLLELNNGFIHNNVESNRKPLNSYFRRWKSFDELLPVGQLGAWTAIRRRYHSENPPTGFLSCLRYGIRAEIRAFYEQEIQIEIGSHPVTTIYPEELCSYPESTPTNPAIQDLAEKMLRYLARQKDKRMLEVVLYQMMPIPVTFDSMPGFNSRQAAQMVHRKARDFLRGRFERQYNRLMRHT